MRQLLFILIIFNIQSFAQPTYQWAFNLGGTSGDEGFAIAVDSSGNCYVTGYFQGTNIDFDPPGGTALLTSASGSADIFVAKYNSSGIYQWALNVGGTGADGGRGIAVDGSGNCYVTGDFQGASIDFNPLGGAVLLSSSAGSRDIFVAKYNSSGICQWAFNIGGTGADYGYGIAVDGSGNCYVTGEFQGASTDFNPLGGAVLLSSAGGSDIYVAKYNSSGICQWAFDIGWIWPDEGYDIVYGFRKRRQDNFLRKLASKIYRWLSAKLTNQTIGPDIVSFRIMTRPVVDYTKQLRERSRTLSGLVRWLGFPYATVDIEHGKRAAGESKYGLWVTYHSIQF